MEKKVIISGKISLKFLGEFHFIVFKVSCEFTIHFIDSINKHPRAL